MLRYGMGLLVWCAAMLSLSGATIATFDRGELSGDLVVTDYHTLALNGQQFTLADCDWIELTPAQATEPRSGELPSMILADGGWIAARSIAPAGDDQVVVLTPQGQFQLALGQFLAWGPTEWLAREPTSDQDVVVVDGERFVGAVTGLRDGKLMMEIDGLGANEIVWERITAFRLALSGPKLPDVYAQAEFIPGRSPVAIRLGVRPSLAVAPDQELAQWPSGRLRVMSDRRAWLSDLAPESVAEEGAFGITWPYQADQNMDGGPIQIDGQIYRRGLVIHSRANLSWNLEARFDRFHAMLGIEDVVGAEGDCAVIIWVDDVVAWEQGSVRGGQSAVPIAIDCDGAQRLTIEVDYGAKYDIADHLALGDAYLVRTAPR